MGGKPSSRPTTTPIYGAGCSPPSICSTSTTRDITAIAAPCWCHPSGFTWSSERGVKETRSRCLGIPRESALHGVIHPFWKLHAKWRRVYGDDFGTGGRDFAMKRIALFTIALFLVAAATAVAQDVRYNFDKNSDFSKF